MVSFGLAECDTLLNFLYFKDQVSDLGLFIFYYVLDQCALYQSTKTWDFILVFLHGKLMLWSRLKPIARARHNWRKCNRLAYISIHWHCQYVLLNEKAREAQLRTLSIDKSDP